MKWQVDEMTSWWNDKLMKWQVDEMTSWWNDKLMKCQADEMTSWWNDKLIKCEIDEMASWLNASWQNGKLIKWHGTKINVDDSRSKKSLNKNWSQNFRPSKKKSNIKLRP